MGIPRRNRGRDGAQEERGLTMGFRFLKRVRLIKGAWINLFKRGGYLSTTGIAVEARAIQLTRP
jgi:hypothetical protein